MPGERTLRVLLVGEESAGLQVLRLLAEGPHEIVRVLTAGEAPGSVRGFAVRHGIPVDDPAQVREPDFADEIAALGVDLLLNVHALHLIHPDVLSTPGIGSFNLHPGPLPGYAGLNAPSWAVYHGESGHAVTLHWITADVDAGPVAFDSTFSIDDDATGLSVFRECVRRGVPLVRRLLETAASDPADIPRRVQDPARRRVFGRRPPADGLLHWSRSAREITAFVRACDYHPFPSPWGHPATLVEGRRVEVLKAHPTGEPTRDPPGTVGEVGTSGAWVAAGDEWVSVERVRRGTGAVEACDVLRFGQRLTSMDCQEEIA